ncbi:hypothetical protein BASA50_009156 [Batrachochytrium salamandrivorans]|uniref:non-specific serine/threonine protein kinase n=1 Tax=Batrachochytrium salamandrivorans TaxID=1357716 RepID=A0ABQ8F264_9FUNG|nr:hypothetical protein BASA50_009156 [Batrachochytrium salamandrivorans]
MFDPLLWALHHFVIHYAGQTTQGDTDDDDDDGDFDKTFDSNPKYRKIPRFLQGSRSMDRHSLLKGDDIPNQSGASSSTGSKSKKADRFLQRLRSMNKYKPFQENDISDESGASSSTGSKSKKIGRFLREPRSMDQYGLLQGDDISDESDTSSSTDLKSRKRRKGSVWEESPSKSPPQQQSLPVSQPSTSYDPPQSDEILLPRYMGKKEAESYLQSHNPEQYSAFIEDETKYFILTYSLKKILGEGGYGAVYLATKKSDGMEVACKSIPRQNVYYYALELKPPPRCNLRNPLVGSDEQSVEQCMSPRPSGLYVAHEAILQMYLSQPGNASPYVARALDYITLQDRFMLIMEYLGKSWMTLFSYMKERIRLDIKDACNIIKEVINAVIDLKQHGVFHKNIHSMSQ